MNPTSLGSVVGGAFLAQANIIDEAPLHNE